MPIQSRQLRAFDLIEFDGSTNVASVRKIVTEDGEQVAILRYMRDDGELDYAPFTLTVRAILKICSIRDEGVSRNTRRPVLVGCASKERASVNQEARPTFDGLATWARKGNPKA